MESFYYLCLSSFFTNSVLNLGKRGKILTNLGQPKIRNKQPLQTFPRCLSGCSYLGTVVLKMFSPQRNNTIFSQLKFKCNKIVLNDCNTCVNESTQMSNKYLALLNPATSNRQRFKDSLMFPQGGGVCFMLSDCECLK